MCLRMLMHAVSLNPFPSLPKHGPSGTTGKTISEPPPKPEKESENRNGGVCGTLRLALDGFTGSTASLQAQLWVAARPDLAM